MGKNKKIKYKNFDYQRTTLSNHFMSDIMGRDFIGIMCSLNSVHSSELQLFGDAKLVNVNPFTDDLESML